MDYAEAQQSNAKLPGYGVLGASAANGVRQPRTFDQIEHSVADLAELNKRLSAALDRLGHCASETCDVAMKELPQKLGPDYGRSLSRLEREISELRGNVSALETHI